jgi:hypothetical protein
VTNSDVRSATNIYVYEISSRPNVTTKASVAAACLAILERHRDMDLHVWTVAATREQVITLPRFPWVLKMQQIGCMERAHDKLVFRNLLTGDTWRVPLTALAS